MPRNSTECGGGLTAPSPPFRGVLLSIRVDIAYFAYFAYFAFLFKIEVHVLSLKFDQLYFILRLVSSSETDVI